jgi:hypothetical protein
MKHDSEPMTAHETGVSVDLSTGPLVDLSTGPLVDLSTAEQVEQAMIFIGNNVLPQLVKESFLYQMIIQSLQSYATLLMSLKTTASASQSSDACQSSGESKREAPVCQICKTDPPEYIVFDKSCCHMCYCEDCATYMDPMIKIRTRFSHLESSLPARPMTKCPICRVEGPLVKVWY